MTTFFSTLKARRKKGVYDSALELRDYDAAALSATGSEAGVSFPVRAQESFRVVINMAAYSGYVATTAEWTISVEVSDVVGGTYTEVASLPAAASGGAALQVPLDLNGALVEALDADAAFIRVTATKTGSPGDLTYGAYIVC